MATSKQEIILERESKDRTLLPTFTISGAGKRIENGGCEKIILMLSFFKLCWRLTKKLPSFD
jgi:hypothetical protein